MTDTYFSYILTSCIYRLQPLAHLTCCLDSGIILIEAEAYCWTLLAWKWPSYFYLVRIYVKGCLKMLCLKCWLEVGCDAEQQVRHWTGNKQEPPLRKREPAVSSEAQPLQTFQSNYFSHYLFARPFNARGLESPVLLTSLTLSRQDTNN